MSSRGFRSMMARAAVVAVLSLAPVPVTSQIMYPPDTPKQPAAKTWLLERAALPAFDPPRTPEGNPDLRGHWRGGGGGDDIEEHPYVDATTPPRESNIVDPPDGKIPYQPWAAAKRTELRAGSGRGLPGETLERLHVSPATFCLLSATRSAYRSNFKVLQSPGFVVILLAWGHYYRIIPTDGRPHLGEHIKLWMGNSRGRWEGNTLVVDVTNQNAKEWLDAAANFYSDAVHVVERWTLAEANTIDYEITIDDPQVYSRPWKMAMPLRRNTDPNDEIWEEACHEGTRDYSAAHVRKLGFKFFFGVIPPK